jgi:hypothetical protein
MFLSNLFRRCATAFLLILIGGMAVGAVGSLAADRLPIPKLTVVQQAVLQYFQAQTDYQSGDWITQESVRPVLKQLQKIGLPLPDAGDILDDTPTKDEFLSEQLATPAGRKFMRRIARFPNAFDRLDRLSGLSNGRRLVRNLIRDPGGDKMIEYMTTVPGGRQLGRMLSNTSQGADFNAATGRVYTVDLLLKRLEQSRAASIKDANYR